MAASNSGSPDSKGPVGSGNYQVQPGDCMQNIASNTGFLWQTLWNLPENADLKSNRVPNILLPGDRLTIPPIQPRVVNASTDQLHKFVRLGTGSRLKLRFLDDQQQPRSGIPYLLNIDGQTMNDTLDDQGSLDVAIPCKASRGSIQLQTDSEPETYPLSLGHLDPDDSPTGIRARLQNLGFNCASDGGWNDDLRKAVQKFQMVNNFPVTGQLDDQTLQALRRDHQS